MTTMGMRAVAVFSAISIGLLVLLMLLAGTVDFWQAWAFVAVFAVFTLAIGIDLALRDPALLARRLSAGPGAEQSLAQRIISAASLIVFMSVFVICAICRRYGWSTVPAALSIVGDVLVIIGLRVWFLTFRANTYGASTVKVFEGQRVISTGPYALVRHPMYVALVVTLVGIPIALGAWPGLTVFVLGVPVLVWRILDEERFLRDELPGYPEYLQRVRWRLVPGIW